MVKTSRTTGLTRRGVILQGAALVVAPVAAPAQQPGRIYRIGVLTPSSRAAPNYDGLFDELRLLGFVEGQNLVVDGRGFAGPFDRFPELAMELTKAGADAILCGGDAAIRAVQQATTTIPIIGVTGDFLGAGFVQSLARPGLNTTGVSLVEGGLDGKRQDVLIDLVPGARRMAALADFNDTPPRQLQLLQDAAHARGIELLVFRIARRDEIVPAINAAKEAGAEAVNFLAAPLFNVTRDLIIARTAALRLPAIYQWPEMAEQGGLAAYGARFSEVGRLQARLLVKVLRGAKPADLPVQVPTKFELVINLRTAKAMDLKIPPTLLALADQVIE